MQLSKFWAVAILVFLTAGTQMARADNYTIGTPNTALSVYPGPYAFVDAKDISGGVEFTVTGNQAVGAGDPDCPNGGCYYLIFDGGAFSFNVSSSIVLSASNLISATGVYGDGTHSIPLQTVAPQSGAWGSFSLMIDFVDGPKNGAQSATFDVTGISVSDLTPNVDGHIFSVHVQPTSQAGYGHFFGSAANVGTLATGFATETVPDGGMTLMLLGGALVGVETLRRRFRA